MDSVIPPQFTKEQVKVGEVCLRECNYEQSRTGAPLAHSPNISTILLPHEFFHFF